MYVFFLKPFHFLLELQLQHHQKQQEAHIIINYILAGF